LKYTLKTEKGANMSDEEHCMDVYHLQNVFKSIVVTDNNVANAIWVMCAFVHLAVLWQNI